MHFVVFLPKLVCQELEDVQERFRLQTREFKDVQQQKKKTVDEFDNLNEK